MLTFGALSFSAPWLLAGLLALPVLWWLLKVSPPLPRRLRFPALRLLLGLRQNDETPAQMPWWLMALRAALAAILLIALAGPLWNAGDRSGATGPLVLVVDTGWAAAPGWSKRTGSLRTLIEEAARDRRSVMLVPTAGTSPPAFSLLTAADARPRAAQLAPQPYAPNRAGLLARLDELRSVLGEAGAGEIIWLSDGLDYGSARAFADALAGLGPLRVLSEPSGRRALALANPETDGGAFEVPVLRAFGTAQSRRSGRVSLVDSNGRTLAGAPFVMEPEDLRAIARFDIPAELRNRGARLRIDAHASAASVMLLDGTWRRRPVGLVSGSGQDDNRPLLADLFYLRRALEPFADLREGTVETLLTSGLSVLILSDVGQIVGDAGEKVGAWVEGGGVLVRFAGPRLAEQSDDLIPVALRRGGRALGGTLSWDTPQGLAPFPDTSPFAGLTIPEEVTVGRQVLAEPVPDLDQYTWARLDDGTPLVTARREGSGWLVLIHVTANQDWSTLPLSGLYVEMLRRLIDLSSGIAAGGDAASFAGAMAPVSTLNGFGELGEAPPETLPLTAAQAAMAPDARHPPGYYGRGDALRAYNLAQGTQLLKAAPDLSEIAAEAGYLTDAVRDLRPVLIGLALALFLADVIATLWLTGALGALRGAAGTRSAAGLFLACAIVAVLSMAPPALAQTGSDVPPPVRQTSLAYILTGDSESDAITRTGLTSLGQVLASRTAFEPGPPVGLDPATDDLTFYPLIYWRVGPNQQPLVPEALARIDLFMKTGGTILFDTADTASRNEALDAAGIATAQGTLRTVLRQLDVPPLTAVPEDHVLRRAFYLLSEFPGRYAGGTVWVQAPETAGSEAAPSRHDGVSPLIIGANDWVAAWARDASGQPLAATVPGGERQRELAYRFGVNVVMYTLTGNYKADQVHVPAILERLGQ